MARKKLIRFKKALEFNNVYALEKLSDFKFANKYQKKVLEIGCGHGLFSYEYAKNNLDSFVMGVDVKLDRIFKGASLGLDSKLDNLYFFRCPVNFLLNHIIDLKFEELLSDPVNTINKLIDFCDLDRNDDYINFYSSNSLIIKTASANQARKPIQKSNIYKYKHFKDYFDFN